MKHIKKYVDKNKIILVILLILMILPSKFTNLSISINKISSTVVVGIFIYLLKTRRDDIKEVIKDNKFIICNIIFAISIVLSIIINLTTRKATDFLEPVKYIIFPMVTIIIMIICKKKEYYIFFLKIISIAMIVICIFGIMQYFNVLSINERYIKLYAPTQYKTLIGDYPNPRIVGVKTTPPIYGMLVAVGVYFNLLYFKYAKNKLICLLSMLLCVINLIMTLTRTIQIAFMCSLIVYIFIIFLYTKGLKKAINVSLIATIGIIGLILILPNSITWRLMQVLDFSNATSWIARTRKWEMHFRIISQNLLFGIGPIKNYVNTIEYIDSEWIQSLLQYGLFGVIIYINMLFSPIYSYFKQKNNKKIIKYYLPILILIFIQNITASTMIDFASAVIIYTIIGLILINNEFNDIKEGEK